MSFLFKSKKTQDRALASRDGNSGSQSSLQGAGARGPRDEKAAGPARATPTGSLNSLDNEGIPASPERANPRRGGSLDQNQPSDLPVSCTGSTRGPRARPHRTRSSDTNGR